MPALLQLLGLIILDVSDLLANNVTETQFFMGARKR
jgi:hypothetical protein